MSKPNSVPYAVRNDLCARLNKSPKGLFLDEFLRRGSIHALKIANSQKLTTGLIRLLNEHPALKILTIIPEDGGKERAWAINVKRHSEDDLPEGYRLIEPAIQEPPKRVELSVYKDPQTTKFDPPPTPSPVVYSTKPLEKSSVFEALKQVAPRQVEEERIAPDDYVEVVETTPVVENHQPSAIEKESVMSSAISPLSQVALLRKQAEEMQQLADNLEREDAAVKRLDEMRPVQLEIARATAILQRTSSEMLDAMDVLEKASEKLRVLVTAR